MLTHERLLQLMSRYGVENTHANKACNDAIKLEMKLNQPLYRFNHDRSGIETLYYRETKKYGAKRVITVMCRKSDLDSSELIHTSTFYRDLKGYKNYPDDALYLDKGVALMMLREFTEARCAATVARIDKQLEDLKKEPKPWLTPLTNLQ